MNNKELLKQKYPKMFNKMDDREFRYDQGWNDLIDCLCFMIEDTIKKSNEKYIHYPFGMFFGRLFRNAKLVGTWIKVKPIPQVEVQCIKEKFGTLRFYSNNKNKEIDAMVRLTELLSSDMCEKCGKFPANTKDTAPRIQTLCNECKIKEGINEI